MRLNANSETLDRRMYVCGSAGEDRAGLDIAASSGVRVGLDLTV